MTMTEEQQSDDKAVIASTAGFLRMRAEELRDQAEAMETLADRLERRDPDWGAPLEP